MACPSCSVNLNPSSDQVSCINCHQFPVRKGIVDLLPETPDTNIIEEEGHWDGVADRGGNVIVPNEYINTKIMEDCRKIYQEVIIQHWPNYGRKKVHIGELGCSYGSAVTYLRDIKFLSVDYIGVDVSFKRLQLGMSSKAPRNWNRQYVRGSANSRTFEPNSADIIFCVGALHHFNLYKFFDWVPSSIKNNGLLVLHEPSLLNPVARVARKMVKGFHTPGEKPLIPCHVKAVAKKKGLTLNYERGLHFLNGSLQYLLGKLKTPKSIALSSYYLANCMDKLISSPSLSYSFVQVYKKI